MQMFLLQIPSALKYWVQFWNCREKRKVVHWKVPPYWNYNKQYIQIYNKGYGAITWLLMCVFVFLVNVLNALGLWRKLASYENYCLNLDNPKDASLWSCLCNRKSGQCQKPKFSGRGQCVRKRKSVKALIYQKRCSLKIKNISIICNI